MTLLFMDGFDHYATADMSKKYDSVSSMNVSTANARFTGTGQQGVRTSISGNIIKSLENCTTIIFGVALYITDTYAPSYKDTNPLLAFYDGTTIQVRFHLDPDSHIVVYNGDNTLLGTSSNVMSKNRWQYIEFKVLVSETVGTIDIRVDGASVLALTNQDTANSSNLYINKFKLEIIYNSIDFWIDDLYVCDGLGSDNNDFLGDVRIATIRPNAAGNYTQWTPSAGANYENVDDLTDIDDDTTYNSHNTATEKDSYNLDASPTDIDTVFGIQINTTMRKDDAGTRKAKPFLRTNSTDYSQGSDITLSDSYVSTRNIVEENPNDSAAWEKADLDALEVGIEVIS